MLQFSPDGHITHYSAQRLQIPWQVDNEAGTHADTDSIFPHLAWILEMLINASYLLP